MAPLSSAESLRREFAPHEATLHTLAAGSISAGLAHGEPPDVAPRDYPQTLQREMASFVTLRCGAELRGCVGSAYALRPLVEDVSHNAFNAAFGDPRFAPLTPAEFNSITIELSLLTQPEPLTFADEDDLMAQLVPGRDGLILEYNWVRGLFLPQVWKLLPDRREFLAHLKEKACLPSIPPGDGVRVLRFEAVKIAEQPVLAAPAPAQSDKES